MPETMIFPDDKLKKPENCPTGFNIGHPHQNEASNFPTNWKERLNAQSSYWYNWKFNHLDDPKYIPMIFSFDTWTNNRMTLSNQKKQFFFVGNEPELVTNNFSPRQFNDVCSQMPYTCGPNVSLWGNRGLYYIEHLLKLGTIPYMWGVHVYGIQNLKDFRARIDALVSLLNKYNALRPIVVTEVGRHTKDQFKQAALLQQLYNEPKKNEHIQSIFWFSTYWNKEDEWGAMSLFDSQDELTVAGSTLRYKNW